MNKLEKILEEEEEAVRRALLLTTNEQKLAKARREALRAREQMEAAKADAALARQEAKQLREHIIASSTKPVKIPFRTVTMAFTIVLLVAAVVKLVYLGFTAQPKPADPVTEASTPAVMETPAPHHILTHKAPSAGDLQFKKAMLRLQDDLGSMPDAEAEIVQEVNQHYPAGSRPCPLEWVNGEAALSLDGAQNRITPSLTSAVTECATAIEKYRDKRDAALSASGSLTQ